MLDLSQNSLLDLDVNLVSVNLGQFLGFGHLVVWVFGELSRLLSHRRKEHIVVCPVFHLESCVTNMELSLHLLEFHRIKLNPARIRDILQTSG